MSELKSDKKVDNIWSKIDDGKLVTAIVSLGDRVDQLKKETWRLKKDKKQSRSLWGEIIQKLKLKHTEKTRHSLYNIWHLDRHRHRHIRERVKKELEKEDINIHDDGDSNYNRDLEKESIEENNNGNLPPNPSIPLPEPPKTRAREPTSVNGNNTKGATIPETSFILTAAEWKAVFSCTEQKLKDNWISIFRKKLESCGITCSLRFGNKHVKRGERKHSCRYFWFDTSCGILNCTRTYRTILQNEVDINTSPIFRVRIEGEENHDRDIETMCCQLRGEERDRVGMKV